jgi:hypothetical protein
MKHHHPNPLASHGLLRFSIVPSKANLAAPLAPPTAAGPAPKLPPFRQNLRVEKVISVEDEGYIYRGYVVSWNGEDVIADDALVTSQKRAGESVSVLVMKHAHPDAKQSYGLLHFGVFAGRQ